MRFPRSAAAGALLAAPLFAFAQGASAQDAYAPAAGAAAAPLLLWIWVVFLGLCVGSFLNVVIHRLPIMMQREEFAWASALMQPAGADDGKAPEEAAADSGEAANTVGTAAHRAQDGERSATPAATSEPTDEDMSAGTTTAALEQPYNLMVPRSACPACGHRISALENIPVLSWLLLRGRCRGCGAGISSRYPFIELLTCALTCVVVWLFGFTWAAAWVVLFTWALLAAAVIDLDHQLLPDSIVLPLLWLGLLVNLSGTFTTIDQAVIGAAAGYLTLWTLYWAFRLLTGKEGMGYGDFKLLGAMGAWMGWASLPAIALLSSLTGLIGAALLMLTGRLQRGAPMPFGPFIAAAGWLAMVLPAAGLGLPGL